MKLMSNILIHIIHGLLLILDYENIKKITSFDLLTKKRKPR